jgi:predicted  nucleic acid-binding Zn-ribbon protein
MADDLKKANQRISELEAELARCKQNYVALQVEGDRLAEQVRALEQDAARRHAAGGAARMPQRKPK